MKDLVSEIIANYESWIDDVLQLAAEHDEVTNKCPNNDDLKQLLGFLVDRFDTYCEQLENLRGRRILVAESLMDWVDISREIVENLRVIPGTVTQTGGIPQVKL